MPLPLPASLTPSKVTTFKECALAFRLSAIDKLPEPPSLQAFRGTVVHRALELLMWDEPQGGRTLAGAFGKLDSALEELLASEEGTALGLAGTELEELKEQAHELLRNYFVLEDPELGPGNWDRVTAPGRNWPAAWPFSAGASGR